jgi:hypothetical protein
MNQIRKPAWINLRDPLCSLYEASEFFFGWVLIGLDVLRKPNSLPVGRSQSNVIAVFLIAVLAP